MISKISFTSTYKATNENKENYNKFSNYVLNKQMQDGGAIYFDDKLSKNYPHTYYATLTYVAPDGLDNEIETYCANNGITYKKLETKELLNPKNILDRIKTPEKNYNLVFVDSEKLESLSEKQNGNIKHCQKDFENNFSKDLNYLLRSGREIPATTLSIKSIFGNQDLKEYVNSFGADNLNNNQIFIDFNKRTNEPDHCTYFALKDLNINKIPVYVNNETKEAGEALGLF